MGPSLLGDAAMLGGLQPRLAHLRIQPEVAHQLLGGSEPGDVADRGDDPDSDGEVDSRDGHEAPGRRVIQDGPGQAAVQFGQIRLGVVERSEQAGDGRALVGRQRLQRQPRPALVTEQVGGRAPREEIAVEDRVDLVLQTGPMADDLRPPRDLPTERLGPVIGHPHFRQEPRRVQLDEDRRVDLVRLNLRLGDDACLAGIGDDHPSRVGAQQASDRVGVARRFQNHVIATSQPPRKQLKRGRRGEDPTRVPHPAMLVDRRLGKGAMDIQSDDARHPASFVHAGDGRQVGHTTPTDPRSQRTRASRRGGQILTRARGSWYVSGLPILRAPQCPCPGSLTLSHPLGSR